MEAIQDTVRKSALRDSRTSKATTTDVIFLPKASPLREQLIDHVFTLNNQPSRAFTVKDHCRSTKKGKHFVFECARGDTHQPTARSTRNAGCKAYVSFTVDESYPSFPQHVIVKRVYDTHIGHDPTDVQDKHCHGINKELLSQVKSWIMMGVKSDVVLLLSHDWAEKRNHKDINDRRFRLSPDDIQNIKKQVLRAKQPHKDDATSLQKLVSTNHDSVLAYEPYMPGVQPILIILMTVEMRKNFERYGNEMVFMDATGDTNIYGYPLYALIVQDCHGRGIPVAYVLSSSEDQETLSKALRTIKEAFPHVNPRCFMVDKSWAEINAIREVYSRSSVLLCWFHVTQAFNRWMMRKESGLSGQDKGIQRNEIIDDLKGLKDQTSRDDYELQLQEFNAKYHEQTKLLNYMSQQWDDISHMWANFGRCFNHNKAETNNLVERFFLRLKYQFLGGVRNRRLDALLQVLLGLANNYFSTLAQLQESGRIIPSMKSWKKELEISSQRLISRGWISKVKRKDDKTYEVPSEYTDGVQYTVKPGSCHCTCHQGARGFLCKHIQVTLDLHFHDGLTFPSKETHIQLFGEELISCYSLMETPGDVAFHHPHNDNVFVSVADGSCTCTAFSYWNDCACIRLAREVCPDIATLVATLPQSFEVSEAEAALSPETAQSPGTATSKEDLLNRLKVISLALQSASSIPEGLAGDVNAIEARLGISASVRPLDNSRRYQPLHAHRAVINKRKRETRQSASASSETGSVVHSQTVHGYARNPALESTASVSLPRRKKATSGRGSLKKQKLANGLANQTVEFLSITMTPAAKAFLISTKTKTQLPADAALRQNYLQEVLLQTKLNAGGIINDNADAGLLVAIEVYLSE